MSDHLLTFLEQLYALRMKAGMNVQYHRELAAFWSTSANITAVVMVVFAFLGSILTVLAAWKPNAKFVKQTRWIAVGLACISVVAGIVFLTCDMKGRAASYHSAFVQWRDIRGDVNLLMDQTARSSDGDNVPDLFTETLAILQAKVTGIEKNEPETTDDYRIDRCWTDQVRRIYGVTTEDEVDDLKRTDPDKWTRLRYGFVPRHQRQKRKQSSTGIGSPGPTASRSQSSGSTVR